ncbi:DNA cytosine methyltransferase [Porticoccaceae bacterium]|nr:DNA cytosine methyltransferase [Porticoccaceae bacterium]
MKYIELFAGCGGLSVGLESLGYEIIFANELSPMASETFAYNLLGENLRHLADNKKTASQVKWISSQHSPSDLAARLRENPQNYPSFSADNTDLGNSLEEIQGKLIVGSIVELNRYLSSHQNISDDLREQDVDLVSGGPPCQSFSLAGLRQHDNNRNRLPMDFAELVGIVRPKVALLENVSGILRAFNLPDGKHYAWFEVAKAFASKGYYPLCLHVNAKYAGAAQNRPRFIMLALRDDIFKSFKQNITEEQFLLKLTKIESFFNSEHNGETTAPFEHLDYYDIEKHPDLFETDILSPLYQYKDSKSWFSVKDAIDDLREGCSKITKRAYPKHLDKTFRSLDKTIVPHDSSENSAPRLNSPKVRMRFKLYQYLSHAPLSKGGKSIQRDVVNFLKDPLTHVLAENSIDYLIHKKFLLSDGESLIEFGDKKSLIKYLGSLATKKQTQRALLADRPAPAALSIPDDACHYHPSLQRTLTVREMARFQSFPDRFEFRSKITTGGKMRRYEVPQYTQVGNAVPPLLGRALGKTIINILAKTNA